MREHVLKKAMDPHSRLSVIGLVFAFQFCIGLAVDSQLWGSCRSQNQRRLGLVFPEVSHQEFCPLERLSIFGHPLSK